MSKSKSKSAQSTTQPPLDDDRLSKLLAERRWCYFIAADSFVEGHGFRVSIVIENEQGHYPTGSLRAVLGDYSNGATLPWFWGMTYDEARAYTDQQNLKVLKLTVEDT